MGFISKMIWSAIGAKATNKMSQEEYPTPTVIPRSGNAIVQAVVPKDKGSWKVYISINGKQYERTISTRTSSFSEKGCSFKVEHPKSYIHWI
ncbi:hypothetical protein [Francisella philomiragia]|uniref:Uncharacterized protein n=1 Tax=Francisella philomiragia TaxID=28110 RepID=A0A0B6CWY6_9GAMM|nr:hypothetical protein [Francisella philomiragia]AJI53365.1 hypothetical protein LA55_1600 [Francisella philomiragia]MBY7735259.1 hypothetical protein [Francisella philomiragia]